ncbi:DNA binding protein [Aspergillus hancockii]|nr:DNA binding protein [Aspergillus hancockii]
MARIKYTVPASGAVQVQSARVLHDQKNGASTQDKTQSQVKDPAKSIVSERFALKQQQSLEMVQIMLHVSFGTLFYLREFLPLLCFDDRDLKEAQRENRSSYREFLNSKPHYGNNGDGPDIAFGNGKRGQPLKVIIRGTDPKADMILDVLETGIFDALRRNILEAIQLTILVDKDTPENVLESYTFSFNTISQGGIGNDSEAFDNTQRFSSDFAKYCNPPEKDDKRNLGIHLFYTEDCPSEYEPPGFTTANKDTIKYPLNEHWRKESQSCGTMNSGWHTVGLRVTSLKWTGPDPEGSEAVPTVPSQLEYTDEVSRTMDIGFADELSNLHHLEMGNGNGISSGDHLALDKSSAGHGASSYQEATQDIVEREKLQNMIPTQGTSSYSDNDLIPTQPISPDIATGNDNQHTSRSDSKWSLSSRRIPEIREYVRSQKLASDLPHCESQPQSLVRCQCGWNGEEPGMIECAFCHTRQHPMCYGFKSASDSRAPDVHACYRCLLEPDETQLLQEMDSLVLLRRALKIILDEGFPNKISDFTQKLHCNGQTIVQITEILKKQRFIQPTPGYKLKGFSRRGLPKFSIFQSHDVHQRMTREILHPMVKIKHHYVQEGPPGHDDPNPSSSSQELVLTTKSAPEAGDMSVNGYGLRSHETQRSNRDLPELLGKNRNQKRKPLPGSDRNGSYESDDLDKNDRAAEEQLHNSFLTDESMRTKTKGSSRRSLSGQSPRRSSRKRRKISNYSKLIDVGAETSDHESD